MPTYEQLESSARQMVQDYPLQNLMGAAHLDERGKVVHRTPPSTPGDPDAESLVVRSAMLQHAAVRHAMIGQAVVHPSALTIREEHDCSESAILSLLAASAFVPEDRRILFARGFAAGFAGDYRSAIHLLVPQIENSIRQLLAAHGAIVSSLDDHGVQQEKLLGALLHADETKDLLSPGIVFDLQALLVDPGGANLRNRLAHGLLSDATSNSPEAAYAFWLTALLVQGIQYHEGLSATSNSADAG